MRVKNVLAAIIVLSFPPFAATADKSHSAFLRADQLSVTALQSASKDVAEAQRRQILAAYADLPLSFEPNQGQSDAQVKFVSRGRGYILFLTSTEAVLVLHKPAARAVVRMKLVAANPTSQVTGLELLPGKSNFFIGNDPKAWRTDIPHYARVEYEDIYPGVDLLYYGHQGKLEYDFEVAPGADPSAIQLAFEGVEELTLDDEGNLILSTDGGEVVFQAPGIYQESGGVRRPISGRYALQGGCQVGFEIAAYDASKPLIIDPVFRYSTYFGGSSDDSGMGIAVDVTGNAYVTGFTASSTDLPLASSPGDSVLQPAFGGGTEDAFVTKFNLAGSALIFSTYLGGSGDDRSMDIALDAIIGDPVPTVYLTGFTSSANFPRTLNAPQIDFGGGAEDAFITRLSTSGSALRYSTYLGGSGNERGLAIAVDKKPGDTKPNAYVTGFTTSSTDFPVTAASAAQPVFGGGTEDIFVTKMSTGGSDFRYSTYLGGNGDDRGLGIAVDDNINAYVTGVTSSADFPVTPSAAQPLLAGTEDAFILKLGGVSFGATLDGIDYATYLGGSGTDRGTSIVVDAAGNTYVTGFTASVTGFPITAGVFQPAHGGGLEDAFVTKLDAAGSAFVYASYLGGSGDDRGIDVAVDATGNLYVTGFTESANFPLLIPIQSTIGGARDAFVTNVNADASGLIYSTYMGGLGTEEGNGIALSPSHDAYVTGFTNSTDLPTTPGALQGTLSGGQDGFVAKITLSLAVEPPGLIFGEQLIGTTSAAQTVTVTNVSGLLVNITSIVKTGGDFAAPDDCGPSLVAGASCTIFVTFAPTAEGVSTGQVTITSDGLGSPHPIPLSGKGVTLFASLSSTSLNFANQPLGTTSAAQNVTLSNTGTGRLTFAGIIASGDFAQTNNCGTSLAAGANCTVSVTFTPTATGARTGEVTITSNAPASPHIFALSGNGTDFSLSASPTAATISAGQSATYTLTLSPISGFAGDVSLACSGAPQAATCTISPATVTLDGTTDSTADVTVSTTAPAMVLPLSGPPPGLGWLPWLLALAMLVGLARAMQQRVWLSFATTLLLLGLLSACNGGGTTLAPPLPSGGTPPGTSTLTVDATSSGLSHSVQLNLTVN